MTAAKFPASLDDFPVSMETFESYPATFDEFWHLMKTSDRRLEYQDGKIWFCVKADARINASLNENPHNLAIGTLPFLEPITKTHMVTNFRLRNNYQVHIVRL